MFAGASQSHCAGPDILVDRDGTMIVANRQSQAITLPSPTEERLICTNPEEPSIYGNCALKSFALADPGRHFCDLSKRNQSFSFLLSRSDYRAFSNRRMLGQGSFYFGQFDTKPALSLADLCGRIFDQPFAFNLAQSRSDTSARLVHRLNGWDKIFHSQSIRAVQITAT